MGGAIGRIRKFISLLYIFSGATPSFFLNSKSPISGLSNDISFVSSLLLEGGQNGQNEKPSYKSGLESVSPTVYVPFMILTRFEFRAKST